MPISNYPNGFANGVNIRGIPVLNTYPGNVFWVDSGAGSNGNKGTFDRPFATLDYAVGRCTADNGDIIILKAGHAESLIADSGVDIDVAGVTVIGQGTGSDRPTFTFTTAVTADFKLAANNVTVKNILFKAGIDALTGPIEVSADDCAIIDCEYQDDDTNNYETVDVVVTASTPLRLLIDGFKFIHDGGSGGTQNQSVIQLNGADKAVIRNCHLVADSGTGVIEDATVSDQILIENCVIESSNAGPVVAVFLQATTTGTMRWTHLRVASGTTYLTATNDMQFYECWGTGTDATTGDKVGTALAGDVEAKIDVIDGYHDVPSADAATNTQMRDVVGNKTDAAAAGAVSGTESLMAYVKQIVGQLGTDADTDAVAAALYGAGGISTFPAAAAAGNAVSIAEVLRYIQESQIGTLTNTGGTATLGGIIGDVANTDIATRLGTIDGFHDVPGADAVTNLQVRDVVGNKTDTNAGNSLYANDLVPTADSAGNTVVRDVVGNKTDTNAGNSIYANHLVPTADSAGNTAMRDVIGNKTDTNAGNSILSYHLVQTADAATNATARDVVGNKTDAAVYSPGTTKSTIAHVKGTSDLQEKVVVTGAAVMVNGNTLFTITGGPIRVLGIWSECVTGNDATASTLQYNATPTAGSAQTISGASASLANALAGASVSLIGGTLAAAALYNANGPNLGMVSGGGDIIVPAGVIDIVVGVGSTTGTWRHYLRYAPLATGVTVA